MSKAFNGLKVVVFTLSVIINLNTNAQMNTSIFPKGEKASPEYFTGTAWVNILVPQDETGTYSIGNVVFEPGCRNNWHIHPAGRVLIVTDGKGWYQERGKPARAISKGDIVGIPSNVEHWHGASKNSGLTHLAITNNSKQGAVQWLGGVTDEEYNSLHAESNAKVITANLTETAQKNHE